MKKLNWIFAAVLLLLASSGAAPAQTGKTGGDRTARQVLDELVTMTESQVVGAADAMPEEKFAFVPSSGEFKGARTFAQQVKHVAANNYGAGALMLGRKLAPEQASETGPDGVRTKAEIMEYLRGSFAALHQALATINERNEVEAIPGSSGTWERTRLGIAVGVIAHSFDHYGQMVEYLRMNGIVPPASR